MKTKGVTGLSFAEKSGYANESVSRIINSPARPSTAFLEAFCKATDTNEITICLLACESDAAINEAMQVRQGFKLLTN